MNSRMMNHPLWQGSILSLAGYNYFFYSIVAIYISYLPVYFSSKGITPSQIGVLLGVGPLISIFSPPIWGYLSDKHKTIKGILLIILIAAVAIGTLLFRASEFEAMLFLVIVYNFFMSPIGPLTDGLSYRISEHYRVSFGSIRLFGSIGFATTALLMGIIFDRIGLDTISWVYLGYGILAVCSCFILQDAPASTKPVSVRALFKLFKDKNILWFLTIVLILSIPHRINDGFLGVYINSLGGSTGLVGQAWFFSTASEAVVLGFSIRWLRADNELLLMAIAALLYCIRWTLSAMLAEDPIWVANIQLFHGLTFAIYYLAAMQYIYRLVPPELRSTGQTVFAAVFFGIAGIFGSLAAGWIFENYSGIWLYYGMAGCSWVGLCLILFTMLRNKGRNRHS